MAEIIIFIVLGMLNLMMYVIAFWISSVKRQSVKIYVVCLGIQLFLVLLHIIAGNPKGSDAAGNGMSAGFIWLFFMFFHAIVFLILTIKTVVLIIKVFNNKI